MATIPLGRYGSADEFGRVGAFLLSDAAAYMTGATVQVDGGDLITERAVTAAESRCSPEQC